MSDSIVLLKWPGGKRALLKDILPFVPSLFNRYYEPFLGGGSLFFALHPSQAVLADSNAELINCYTQVRDFPEEVITQLLKMKNTKEDYYAIRESTPTDDISRAARLIYLMTLSFNGIHRVNAQGHFNVPYSYDENAQHCNADKIRAVSAALSSAKLLNSDFEEAVSDAREGDFIYFDPPYTVAHGNNGFLKYNAHIFSWKDQIRLATVACDLADRGCYVLVSNADHYSIRELYSNFNVQVITRSSAIAASVQYRRKITECLFHNLSQQGVKEDAEQYRVY